ncbi:MAG: hypothetical protein ABSA79_03645 [Candidatus Bathyarchaeia archaeon]|jgi:hypothetical protein
MSSPRKVRKYLLPTLLILILAISIPATYMVFSSVNKPKANPGAYIGVAFCGNTTQEAELLIDRVKSYTNLFILDAGVNVRANQTTVEEICDYAVANGLSVIINMGIKDVTNPASWNWFWQTQSLDAIKQRWTQRWGDKFLGIYYNDEVGGLQLDANWRTFYTIFGSRLNKIGVPVAEDLDAIKLKMQAYLDNGTLPTNYDLEANFFVNDVMGMDPGVQNLTAAKIPMFISDYGLYWWDYLGGYSTVFTELGWNVSVAEQIAQVKGAARMQGKDWGVMITWTYEQWPYLAEGDEIYNQMLTSYEAGAKYIAVFNYPYNGSVYGAMDNGGQFLALQRFWDDITTKKFPNLSAPEAALVLPHNFGWGMRNPNDTIWGFWLSDNRTQMIGTEISMLLAKYGPALDIVFDDTAYPVSNVPYQHVYYWNQTINL